MTAVWTNARSWTKSSRKLSAGLLPHEYVHSWNGKYRRPDDLATPDYQQPMQDDLLWVYEGLTEYLGFVLTARSGLLTPEEDRDDLAVPPRDLDHRPGRNMEQSAGHRRCRAALYYAPKSWYSWRRGTDYYNEENLNWLWADSIIRQQTRAKSRWTISASFPWCAQHRARGENLHLR